MNELTTIQFDWISTEEMPLSKDLDPGPWFAACWPDGKMEIIRHSMWSDTGRWFEDQRGEPVTDPSGWFSIPQPRPVKRRPLLKRIFG